MIKKLTTLFLCLVVASIAMAKPVGKDRAREVAEAFFGKAQLNLATPKAATLSATNPEYYVFNRVDGGFVIVAGDDAVDPILAYSANGKFNLENMNPNAAWWMGMISSQIRDVRLNGGVATSAVSKRWTAGKLTAGTPVLEIKTAKWDQLAPYNNVCASKVKSGVYTGCVATAAAIKCRYHEWPQSGTGTIPSYKTSSNYYTVPSNTLGHTYNYSQMPLTDGATSSWTSEQKNQVATLMYDLGTMSYMDYATDGSGAFSSCLAKGLAKYFGYNKQMREECRASYSDETWIEMLKKELNANGPIIYGGSTSKDEGHQFVFDGYDDKNYFHVNWGWAGDEDGYYLLTSLGKSYIFSQDQSALLDCCPDKAGTSKYVDFLLLQSYNTYKGLSTSATSFTPGVSFTCKVGYLYNGGSADFNGKFYIAVYDQYGNWKEDVSSAYTLSGLANFYEYYTLKGTDNSKTYSSISCKITGQIKGGDRLRVHFVGENSEGYAKKDSPGTSDEIILAKEDTYSAAEIAEGTSFGCDGGKIYLTSKYRVAAKVRDSSGKLIFSQTLQENTQNDIDASSWGKGSYTLTLNGGADDFNLTLTF